jgi:hypothetical protein
MASANVLLRGCLPLVVLERAREAPTVAVAQIIRLTEKDDDPEATEFTYEVFAAGGPRPASPLPTTSCSTPTTTCGS